MIRYIGLHDDIWRNKHTERGIGFGRLTLTSGAWGGTYINCITKTNHHPLQCHFGTICNTSHLLYSDDVWVERKRMEEEIVQLLCTVEPCVLLFVAKLPFPTLPLPLCGRIDESKRSFTEWCEQNQSTFCLLANVSTLRHREDSPFAQYRVEKSVGMKVIGTLVTSPLFPSNLTPSGGFAVPCRSYQFSY